MAGNGRLKARQRLALEKLLAGETKRKVAADLGMGERTLGRWCSEHPAFRRAFRDGLEDLAGSLRPLVLRTWRKAIAELEVLLEDEDAKVRLGAAAKLVDRIRPLELVGSELVPAGLLELGDEDDPDAAWDARWTQVATEIHPHPLQLEAINERARFLAMVAGVQSGKTTAGAIAYWKRIKAEAKPRGFYWLIAPDSITGELMREAFEEFAPAGWLTGSSGSGHTKTWQLRTGGRVQFRTAHGERAKKLVARSINGVWLDEFTLLSPEVWRTSIRQRLGATGGWAIFSGSPRGKNWAWDDVWRRTLDHDDLRDSSFAGFTWPSSENPAISKQEVVEARRQLPAAYFRREWEASWESFHGQVFEDFVDQEVAFRLNGRPPPTGTTTIAGVDWGFSKPGAIVVARRLPDATWEVLEEVHKRRKLPAWWVETAKELRGRFGIERFWCDPAEPDRIAEFKQAKLPARGARNEVGRGIRCLAALFKQRRIRINSSCSVLRSQLGSYVWKQDQGGEDTEEPKKENDHTVDALRYAIFSEGKRKKDPVVSVGGAGSSSSSKEENGRPKRRVGERRALRKR